SHGMTGFHDSEISRGSSLNRSGSPIASLSKSGCAGFRRKLLSDGTMTLGMRSTTDLQLEAQASPIICKRFSAGYAFQFLGNEEKSTCETRCSSNVTGMTT